MNTFEMKACHMSSKGKYSACFAILIAVALYPLVSSSFTNPKYAYPLCDSSYAFEIVDGNTFASEHDQCGFHFSGSSPEFSCVPLSLDGIVYPYVDLAVPDGNELKEWSFAAFFNPSSVSGPHVIFHYKYFGTLTEVTEVMLYIDNGIIKVNVVGSGGSPTAILDMSDSVGAGYWTFVALSKIYTSGQLKLAMKTDTPGVSSQSVSSTTTNSFPNDKRLEIPGVIRVGNSHDGGNGGFQGEITCITVYDMDGLANDASEYSLVVNECQNPWGKTPGGLPSSPSTGCVTTTTYQTTIAQQKTTESKTTTAQETATSPKSTTTTKQTIATQQATTQHTSLQQSTLSPTLLPITCLRTATAPETMEFRQLPKSNLTGVTTLAPIQKQMINVVSCALLCSRAISCVAFIVHVLGGVPQSCHLANTFHVGSVISDTDTHLYVQSDC